jgi:hypothetical protein
MEKLERLAPTLVFCLGLGCASSTAPTETPPNPPPSEASSEPASGTDSTESPPAGSTSASSSASTESGKSGDDEAQWTGEKEATGSKPVERTAAETRTTPVIQKVVLDNRKTVRECYDKARKELPDLRGKMIIKFVLDPDGNVKKAELVMDGSDVKAPAVVNCSIDAIKKMKFPRSSRGMDTTVNYPFDFKPDGGGK